jgi:two-component system sensor histidine kinase MprB
VSFRRRVTLSAGLAVAVAAVLMAGAAYVAARTLLYRQVDGSLRRAATVALPRFLGMGGTGAAGVAQGVLTTRAPAPASPAQAPRVFTAIVGPEAVSRLGIEGGDLEAAARRLEPDGTVVRSARVDGEPVRVLIRAPSAGSGILVVAVPLSDVDRTLRTLLIVLFGLAALAVAAGAVGSRIAARRTLAPVRDLTAAAEEVAATRDLAHRISVAEGDDELARLAAAFNSMLAALERSQSAQRRLVADASHELRTPLTSLRANLDLFLRAQELPEAEREAMRRDLVLALRELSVLVDDLVEAAREESPLEAERDLLDLADVVRDALAQAGRLHPAVVFEAALEPTPLVGDRGRLGRAVSNLLDNAARYAPAATMVEVALRGAVLTVRDHGPGIAAGDLPHVFDRFYRAVGARSAPGNGLGLAVVKAAAESHGGRVAATQAPGGGALLTVDLSRSPLRRSAEPAPALR